MSSTSTVAKEIKNNTGDTNETQNPATQDTIPEEAKEKSSLFKSGTWFGWLRLGAKTTGYVLNHGKSLIDKIAAVKIKH